MLYCSTLAWISNTAIMQCFEHTISGTIIINAAPITVILFHILNNGIHLRLSYHSLISISIKLHTINDTIGTMDIAFIEMDEIIKNNYLCIKQSSLYCYLLNGLVQLVVVFLQQI